MTQKTSLRIVGRLGTYCAMPNSPAAPAFKVQAKARSTYERKCRNCGTPMSQCGAPYSSDRQAHTDGWCGN